MQGGTQWVMTKLAKLKKKMNEAAAAKNALSHKKSSHPLEEARLVGINCFQPSEQQFIGQVLLAK